MMKNWEEQGTRHAGNYDLRSRVPAVQRLFSANGLTCAHEKSFNALRDIRGGVLVC
jgi:hypothetical protein